MNDRSVWPDAFYWWIDAVGGYLTIAKPRVCIGRGDAHCDIAVFADLSAKHADIFVEESGFVLVPYADTKVNGQSGSGFSLRDGDRIQLRSVEFIFHQAISWSTTARLQLASRHRLPAGVDGIVLLGETCLLGRAPAHVPADWDSSVRLTRHQGRYWAKSDEPLVIDEKQYSDWGPLEPHSHVKGPWGTFHWEPKEQP